MITLTLSAKEKISSNKGQLMFYNKNIKVNKKRIYDRSIYDRSIFEGGIWFIKDLFDNTGQLIPCENLQNWGISIKLYLTWRSIVKSVLKLNVRINNDCNSKIDHGDIIILDKENNFHNSINLT